MNDWGNLLITGASNYVKYLSDILLKPELSVLPDSIAYEFIVAYNTSFLWLTASLAMLSRIISTESYSLVKITPSAAALIL